MAIGNVSTSEKLGTWYLDYSYIIDITENNHYGQFDNNGIPLTDYDKLYERNKWYFIENQEVQFGIHYTPVVIAQYAFGLLDIHKKNSSDDTLKLFKKCADWFVENINIKGDYGIWEHTWTEPVYNIKAPWISAMTQGEAVSLLLRAYQLFNDNGYLAAAEKAFNSFIKSHITFYDDNRNIWFEEFPTNPPSCVLNGYIFALFGIFDYYRVTEDKESLRLWNEGIKTLEKNIVLYDSGYWTRYDLLFKRIASNSYHFLHIDQLNVLYQLTGVTLFYDTYIRWEKYKRELRSYLKRRINGRFYNRIISKRYGLVEGIR